MGTSPLKDSGERREFETGSVRDTAEGKGRFDLLSVTALVRDAQHMENGANKYSDRNWEKGQPLSVYINSALRHIVKLMLGLKDEDHASAAVWNLNAYRHTLMMIEVGHLPANLDDRYKLPDGIAEKIAAELFPDCVLEDEDPNRNPYLSAWGMYRNEAISSGHLDPLKDPWLPEYRLYLTDAQQRGLVSDNYLPRTPPNE